MKHICDNHLFIYLGWDQRSPHLLSQQQAFHASASRNTQGLLDIASLFLFHFHFQTKTICESVNKDTRGLLQKLLSFRYQKPNQIPIECTVSNPEFEPNQISEPEPDENRSSFDFREVD